MGVKNKKTEQLEPILHVTQTKFPVSIGTNFDKTQTIIKSKQETKRKQSISWGKKQNN